MSPTSVWDGAAWQELDEIHVWNGSAWVLLDELHAWDGSAWQLIFSGTLGQVTGLTVSDVAGNETELRLDWNSVPDATHYEVWRSTSSMAGDPETNGTLISTETTTLNVRDTGLTPEQTYYYAVRARSGSAGSYTYGAFSNEASGQPIPDEPSLAPSNVVGVFDELSTEIDVTWQDNTGNEDSFEIKREERACGASVWGSGVWSNVTVATANEAGSGPTVTQTWTDSAVLEGKEYRYAVRATNLGGESDWSAWSDTVYAFTDPGTPGSFTVVKDPSDPDGAFFLDWTASSGLVDDYEIERSTSSGSGYALIASIASSLTEYTDSGYGIGASSITGVAASPVNTGIEVSWNAVLEADAYEIYRSTSSGFTPGAGNKVADVSGSLSWIDTGVPPDTIYYYKVRARSDGETRYYRVRATNDCGGASSYALGNATLDDSWTGYTEVSATSYIEAPGVTVSPGAGICPSAEIDITFDHDNSASQPRNQAFEWQYEETGSGSWSSWQSETAGTTSASVSGLTNGTNYTVEARYDGETATDSGAANALCFS